MIMYELVYRTAMRRYLDSGFLKRIKVVHFPAYGIDGSTHREARIDHMHNFTNLPIGSMDLRSGAICVPLLPQPPLSILIHMLSPNYR
jgi:hypothetical protein